MRFKPGDIVFHKGSWDPVEILGYDYIHNGSGGGTQGYRVMMRGWSQPQVQLEKSLLTWGENVDYIRGLIELQDSIIEDARNRRSRLGTDLARLIRNRPKSDYPPGYSKNSFPGGQVIK